MANKKISQLPPKGAPIAATDLIEIAEDNGAGGYVTKSVSGLQPTLVSGTDIVTINSQTLLQSGDLALQTPLVSGTDIVTINSASLLASGNVNLQDTLVSGTNIKTINGSSVLGSGNLVAGGGGVHILIKPVSGRTYNSKTTATYGSVGNALPLNTIRLNPFIPANSLTVSNLQINIGTAVVGGLARILIYSDSNGAPTTKLLESTSLDCSTIGTKTYTASFTFTAGTTYWLGCYSNLTLPNISQYQSVEGIPISMSTFESPFGVLNATATFPTAPSPLGTASLSTLGGIIISLTAA